MGGGVMIPRGMRDIKTHGTLAREGRLVNVARDLHELGGIEDTPHSSGWDIERHIYKKTKPAKTNIDSFRCHFFSEREVRLHQIEIAQSLLAEFRQATAEGLPVALHEIELLETKLTELQNHG